MGTTPSDRHSVTHGPRERAGAFLALVVRKHLASLGIGSSEARWSSSSQNISEVKGYSDWNYNGFFPLVTLALSGPEEALILVW